MIYEGRDNGVYPPNPPPKLTNAPIPHSFSHHPHPPTRIESPISLSNILKTSYLPNVDSDDKYTYITFNKPFDDVN